MRSPRRILGACLVTGGLLFSVVAAQTPAPLPAGGWPPGFGHCCVPHNGSVGCKHLGCQAVVCGIDSFCCETDWDGVCSYYAAIYCPSLCVLGDNDCCYERTTAGCSDQACEELVCADDAPCCQSAWDDRCILGPDGNTWITGENLCVDLCNFFADCARDFILDLDDYAVFSQCITGVDQEPASENCKCADLDGDGDVDAIDWSVLQVVLGE